MTVQAFDSSKHEVPYTVGYVVTEELSAVHPLHKTMKLYPQTLLRLEEDGSYTKVAPGLAILGFELSEEAEATLRLVQYRSQGLRYQLIG